LSSLPISSRGEFRENVVRLVAILVFLGSTGFPDDGHDHADSPTVTPDPGERIHQLEAAYEIHRDGTVTFEQRFRLGVAGVAIKRGPVLNYLTAFQGPARLILDNELEILEVLRDGRPEPFRAERRDGFLSLYIGSADQELDLGDHEYIVRGRMEADWIKGEGEFSTVIDLVSSLPVLPVDSAIATVRFPKGVPVTRYTPAVTGVAAEAERHGPAYEADFADQVLSVRATAPLQVERSFFLNLTWPSKGFAMQSHWLKVMRQHPRLPLAGFSAILLTWAFLLLLLRFLNR